MHPSSTSMIVGGRATGMIGKVLEADQVDLYKGTYSGHEAPSCTFKIPTTTLTLTLIIIPLLPSTT